MPIMPLFSAPSPLEQDIERITSETNTSEDWSLILDLCDQVSTQPTAAKDCFKILIKRLNHQNPHVVLHALTLLDACVNNCGKRFHLEICSREFENEVKRLLTKAPHVRVCEKLLQLIKKWSDMKEFREDQQLNLIPTLYRQLKNEGYKFTAPSENGGSSSSSKRSQKLPSDPNIVTSNQEEEDIAKAIEESLRLSGGASSAAADSSSSSNHYNSSNSNNKSSSSSSFYPSIDPELTNGTSHRNQDHGSTRNTAKETYQVRALYDFEAAEDNELTFKTGEIVVVTDDSDANWWKGSNHRGEGLFPANFVTSDLSDPAEAQQQSKSGKTVQFNEEVRVKLLEKEPEPVVVTTVDPDKIDRLINLLHEADPSGEKPDSEELISLEEQVNMMAPLIDDELQKADRTIASLNAINLQLVDAMNLYHTLMKESTPATAYYTSPHQYQPQMMAQPMPHGYMGQQQQPAVTGMPVYSSPQHMSQQQQQQHPQYTGSPMHQPPQQQLPPGYASQFPPVHSMQHHQQIQAPAGMSQSPQQQPQIQQQQMGPQFQPEYAYPQMQQPHHQQQPSPVVTAYPGSYQMPQQQQQQ